jgi:hypothetical protein
MLSADKHFLPAAESPSGSKHAALSGVYNLHI